MTAKGLVAVIQFASVSGGCSATADIGDWWMLRQQSGKLPALAAASSRTTASSANGLNVNVPYVLKRTKGVKSGYKKHDCARFSSAWTPPATSGVLGSRHSTK